MPGDMLDYFLTQKRLMYTQEFGIDNITVEKMLIRDARQLELMYGKLKTELQAG